MTKTENKEKETERRNQKGDQCKVQFQTTRRVDPGLLTKIIAIILILAVFITAGFVIFNLIKSGKIHLPEHHAYRTKVTNSTNTQEDKDVISQEWDNINKE